MTGFFRALTRARLHRALKERSVRRSDQDRRGVGLSPGLPPACRAKARAGPRLTSKSLVSSADGV